MDSEIEVEDISEHAMPDNIAPGGTGNIPHCVLTACRGWSFLPKVTDGFWPPYNLPGAIKVRWNARHLAC